MIFNADEKYVTVHGRTLFIDNVRYINYSLSGTAFKFRGKSLKVRLTSDYKPNPDCGDIFLPFCAVLVNGEKVTDFSAESGDTEVCAVSVKNGQLIFKTGKAGVTYILVTWQGHTARFEWCTE